MAPRGDASAPGPISVRAYTDVPRRRRSHGSQALDEDTVVFSHFVAINAVIGACVGDDRLVIRSLDNCSVTVVDVDPTAG